MNKAHPRLIAFYLPQYHPIPENDEWWGKGFTEWTNVAKAKPLYKGHYQPHLPADLGFYDLRVPEVRMAQADLARKYGIEGFCYWHYWFAGKRLLERPFNEVLATGKPDFPFCLAWANESWTGIWHGYPNRTLIEQTYPGEDDSRCHFYTLLNAFCDPRYLRIDGKPIFAIYKPKNIPNPQAWMDSWNSMAIREGLPGIYFIAMNNNNNPEHKNTLYDGYNPNGFFNALAMIPLTIIDRVLKRAIGQNFNHYKNRLLKLPHIMQYEKFIRYAYKGTTFTENVFPTVIPNWDNTSRSGIRGTVLHGSTPELFRKHVHDAIQLVKNREYEKRIVFIKSWNEWAEGNYLEPDRRFGEQYLQVIAEEISEK